MTRKEPRDQRELLRQSHLGLQFALTLGLLAFLGHLADERLGTTPLLTFLGACLGFGIGFYQLHQGVYGRAGRGPDRRPGGRDPER